MARVILVGCGKVGMSFAYQLVTSENRADELVLIDICKDRACGDAQDLSHAAAYAKKKVKIWVGDYADCDKADIIVIAAGLAQKNCKQTRTELNKQNANIMKSIVSNVAKTKFNGVYLVVTNPVDAMSHVVQKASGFPHNRVIGSGTTLDSARLWHLLGSGHEGTFVLGEHGDSSFIPWSNFNLSLSKSEKENILHGVRSSAYDIIKKKGSTYYGIGVCMLDIVNAILNDSKRVLLVSGYSKEHDVYMGWPNVLGRGGIEKTLPVKLTEEENVMLQKTVAVIRKTMI